VSRLTIDAAGTVRLLGDDDTVLDQDIQTRAVRRCL
jgi:hypothetical protein